MPNPKTRPTGSVPARPVKPKRTAAASDDGSPGHRVLLVAVAAVALVVATVGYLALRDAGSDERSGSARPELEHVHGLGVDPVDGTLYAGTHYGLFRLPGQGDATLVADRVQDFMGFTVAGPSHLLASGHPGQGQAGPSSVGLIESTDGGNTWQSLSLEGEADFHALEYRHGRVYGLNSMSGEFMVSNDKKSWETRTNLPMADFAVSPEDPDVVLATTQQGLARSDDGGRSFGMVKEAPLLLLVSWAEDGTVVGVTPEGSVQVSTDDGGAWERRADLGAPPEALTVRDKDEIFVAAGGAVLESTDGGRNFAVRYRE